MLFAGILSMTVCLGLMYPCVLASRRLGLVDVPNGRKRHQEPTSLVGGLVIFLAISITNTIFPVASWSFLGWLALVLFIGLLDDIYDVSYKIRLVFHAVVVVGIATTDGLIVNNIGAVFGGSTIDFFGPIAIVFTAIGVIGAINVVNMTDGVDGLLGSLMLVSLLALFVFGYDAQSEVAVSVASIFVLMGALLAFLTVNGRFLGLKRALVFMGDAGSTVLGFYFVYLLIAYSQGDLAVISPVLAGWILGLPLLDGSAVIASRVLDRKAPFYPDRRHLHHLLMDGGLSVNQTVGTMLALHSILVGAASVAYVVFGSKVEPVLFWGFVALVAVRVFCEPILSALNSGNGEQERERSVALEAGLLDSSSSEKISLSRKGRKEHSSRV